MVKYNCSLILTGPSTTGKTEIALRIAEILNGEIINADKFYFIKEFPSMTGLPRLSHPPLVRMHLYEILNPTDQLLTDNDFSQQVRSLEEEIKERDHLPIIEGCYHKFIRALLNSERRYVPIGIKWSSIGNLEARVRKRVDQIFSEEGIEEVKRGLDLGWRNTYVMSKGSMIKPTVEYLDGKISLDVAKEKAVADIIYAALKAYRRFLDIPQIIWIENDPNTTERVVEKIIESFKKYPAE